MNENTLKEMFKGYSNYSQEEYERIWKNAIIVVDTNILLNFYRYSNSTRKEVFDTLKSVKERLWIPYTVAYEYFKNKSEVIGDSKNEISKIINNIKKEINTIQRYSLIENYIKITLKNNLDNLEYTKIKHCDKIKIPHLHQ